MAKNDLKAAYAGVRALLEYAGQDPSREGLVDTPRRVVDAFIEMTEGYYADIDKLLKVTFSADNYDQIIAVTGIEFTSLCIPSRQLVNAVGGAKRACDVRVGDKLWSLKGGQVVETAVLEVSSRKVAAPRVVEVETEEGTFKVTEEHPFATYSGWLEAQDLEGQFVEWAAPRSLCRERYRPRPGYSLGYVIGAVTSDGRVSKRHVTFQVTDRAFAYKFCEHLNAAFEGMDARVEEDLPWPSGYKREVIAGHRVRVTSSYLADLFRQWVGGDAHHMRQQFPHVVKVSEDTARGFVDGYVDGDDHRQDQGSVVTCGNVEFLREFARLVSSRSEHGHWLGNAWQLYVSDNWMSPGGGRQGWYKKHGFQREDHQTDLLESKFVRVLRVSRMPEATKPYTVYSFKCGPEPTFLISGHLSHNCEHHLLPFVGVAHVAYLPGRVWDERTEQPGPYRVVGLSKIPRLVEAFARRLQLQEQLTSQIAGALKTGLEPRGVAVAIEAHHMCMSCRGVRKSGARMRTSAVRGVFRTNAEARAEVFGIFNGRGV